MPHKLQITLSIEPYLAGEAKKYFQPMLNPNDAIRGILCSVKLVAKNIGNVSFPGGVMDSIRFLYSGGSYHDVAPTTIPEIGIGEEKMIFDQTILPMNEGSASIEIFLKSKDGDVVESYQRRTDRPIRTNAWTDVFYVVNRESLTIIWMLEQLLRKLGT